MSINLFGLFLHRPDESHNFYSLTLVSTEIDQSIKTNINDNGQQSFNQFVKKHCFTMSKSIIQDRSIVLNDTLFVKWSNTPHFLLLY